ncbi:3'(2'),5'-bisphosphate nucleotidase CysQ [Chelativorans sp. YIM 93263]|uniref:3'(2'),5'-bisphosphate nucleotidase CysQ n=1 Tax=Chelativorans sp. YIM 93263 TaxID=2906648 RepID=UPI00237813CA|nr:3'(2'),5'-bisphosphate nucleotidase CysQ [Chelativorans sp. YIM 93263]
MLTETATQLPRNETELLAFFEELALAAGREIMRHFEAGFDVDHKADASPVTEADRAAERIILDGLRTKLGATPCVSEEAASAGVLPVCDGDFLLVDPLDGTREFINRRQDFTVNIALVRDGTPVLGVVYAPARTTLYSGRPGVAFEAQCPGGLSIGSRREIKTRARSAPLVIVASRSHATPETAEFIARYSGAETVSVGSSLKFCMLAAGEADLYPRFGRTMQWDTAAGDAVLRAAGGRTVNTDGTTLTYGPKDGEGLEAFANPFFIAEGRAA